jgi:GNAT superfamily N-acetyltransferase
MDIEIRRVRPSDDEALSTFYAELSPDGLTARFLGYTRGITGGLAHAFCTLDHMHDEGFVAIAGEAADDRIVGHLCLAHVSPFQLELGIAVSDEIQGLGVGRRLYETAISWAREHRYTSVVATCFAGNSRVLALLTSAPYGGQVASSGGGVVDVVIPLESHLPQPVLTFPREAGRPNNRRRHASGASVSRPLHVVWRRTPPPGRAAAGSASRESS